MLHSVSKLLLIVSGGLLLLAGILLPVAGSSQAAGPVPHFVEENGQPLTPAVRVLCYASPAATSPLADLWLKTDAAGHPTRNLPYGCNYLAALYLLHEQSTNKPDHGPAYQVYATSWPPGTRQVITAAGTITITDEQPLVLFNVVASLEWEPAPASDYVQTLQTGLRHASAYLYDLTDGQMAFGPVSIHTGGRRWAAADLRFRAANDYRPTAYVGGIVGQTKPFVRPTALDAVETVYAPGSIYLGRFWDGEDPFDPVAGNWAQENAYRTLIHEWSHYALFLYDEYRSTSPDGEASVYCTCPGLPQAQCDASAMAYHYTATELWSADIHGEPQECRQTDQWAVHGQSDWETLEQWGHIQGINTEWLREPSTLSSGLNLGLAGDLFGQTVSASIYLPVILHSEETGDLPIQPIEPIPLAVTEPTVHLVASGVISQNVLNAFYPQIYILESAAPPAPARVLYQGTTVGSRSVVDGNLNNITLFSVRPNSRVRVLADRYTVGNAPGGRFVYLPSGNADIPPVENQGLPLTPDPWQASLDVSYDMIGPRLTTMTLTLASHIALTTTPVAQLCLPDAEIGCQQSAARRKSMENDASFHWSATFTAPVGSELPDYGVIRIEAPGRGELLRWFQQAGGVGPAHKGGHAPLRDGPVMLDLVSALPLEGERNRVIIMPAADYNALTASLPVTISGLIDVPLDVDILLPPDDLDSVDLKLTLFHREAATDLTPVPVTPCRLHILFFDRQTNQWQIASGAGSSDQMNWAAATRRADQGGIFALGWSNVECSP